MRNLQKLTNNIYTHFGQQLSRQHIVNVIGYGSGIFPQTKNSNITSSNTVDIIITKNIRRNPKDYQGIGSYLGTSYIQSLNKHIFPIHFNHILLQNTRIKYGIVSQNIFLSDLIDWNFLTLAGRMHKPILPLIPLDLQTLNTIYGNRRYALHIALLLLLKKQRISLIQLYMKISQLSYMGDVRYMVNVENNNKVKNIVENNLQKFNQVYFPLFKQLEMNLNKGNTINNDSFKFNQYNDQINLKLDPKFISILLSKGGFPRKMYMEMNLKYQKYGYNGTLAEQFLLMGVPEIKNQIETEIKKINRNSSIKMAGNVFLAGGLMTNFNYLMQKINKKSMK